MIVQCRRTMSGVEGVDVDGEVWVRVRWRAAKFVGK